MNEIKEELYQSMMIGNLTISSDTSKQILDYIEEKDKEIERLTNIVNKIEDMLQSPWNIECVNQNNEFLNKLKALKEGK